MANAINQECSTCGGSGVVPDPESGDFATFGPADCPVCAMVNVAREIVLKAREDLGPDLGGFSMVDLLADNSEAITSVAGDSLPFGVVWDTLQKIRELIAADETLTKWQLEAEVADTEQDIASTNAVGEPFVLGEDLDDPTAVNADHPWTCRCLDCREEAAELKGDADYHERADQD